jgi:hypothetical protein
MTYCRSQQNERLGKEDKESNRWTCSRIACILFLET